MGQGKAQRTTQKSEDTKTPDNDPFHQAVLMSVLFSLQPGEAAFIRQIARHTSENRGPSGPAGARATT
jgi:hypothetical protein